MTAPGRIRGPVAAGSLQSFSMAQPHLQGEQSAFPSTRWSRVMVAADLAMHDARSALAELCSAYSYPIYAFIRRKGNDAEKSLDLTQSYFQRLLEKGVLAAIDRRKGRFRSFLRADCEHFLIDQHRREKALERGGGVALLRIDGQNAEGRYLFEPADSMTPDKLFDRTWAVTLLDGVLELLAAKYAESGRGDLFTQIKVVLTEGKGAVPSATLAERSGQVRGGRQHDRSSAQKGLSGDPPGTDRRNA